MTLNVIVLSGGLDSVTLAHRAAAAYPDRDLRAISFDYGQRHARELNAAARCAEHLGMAEHIVAEIPSVIYRGAASVLVASGDVPDGHYAEDTMAATIVPNRNGVMLNLAAAYLASHGGGSLWFAAHSGDHFVYPDCRPEYLDLMASAMASGTDGLIRLRAPFMLMSKAEIVRHGFALGVPFEETWSCYKGGDAHCGTCGTCTERREAFELAGIDDPTEYLSMEKYW